MVRQSTSLINFILYSLHIFRSSALSSRSIRSCSHLCSHSASFMQPVHRSYVVSTPCLLAASTGSASAAREVLREKKVCSYPCGALLLQRLDFRDNLLVFLRRIGRFARSLLPLNGLSSTMLPTVPIWRLFCSAHVFAVVSASTNSP